MKFEKKEIVVRPIIMKDYDRIVEIDAGVLGRRRFNYYRRKMKKILDTEQPLVTSLVAEVGGKVVGFIMGSVVIGEFGVSETTATIETIGVDPEFQRQGLARAMMGEFFEKIRSAGVERVTTQVRWNDVDLLKFFDKVGFTPAKTLNLDLKIDRNGLVLEGQ
jgi:ribosomal protein S18 acetylase RimI-like enzyme